MSDPHDRLYDLLPVVYRQRDTEQGYPLRDLLRVIAEQVNIVEEDIAQLYENWFIETCQDWVVPYIGDLIGYQLVHELGEPGGSGTREDQQRNKILVPRREVANTLRYRRRKGALALLELLAGDTAGWPTRAVQFYTLLALNQALNHLQLGRGRTVDLRDGEALDHLDGPFDTLAHTVDVRRVAGVRSRGRYNIPSIGLFVWRLKAYSVTHTPAYCLEEVGPHCFTFSVLGNDAPLYTHPQPEPEPTHIAQEANLPVPIRRRALEARLTDYYGAGKSLQIWRQPPAGRRQQTTAPPELIPPEAIVVADLTDWQYRPRRGQVAVDPVLGRMSFPPNDLPSRGVWVTYHYAFSADIGGGEYDRPIAPAPQEIPGFWLFRPGDLNDPATLLRALWDPANVLSQYIAQHLSPRTQQLHDEHQGEDPPPEALQRAVMDDLNRLLADSQLYPYAGKAGVNLPPDIDSALAEDPQGEELVRLNRALLEVAYGDSIAPAYRIYHVGDGFGEFRRIGNALAQWREDNPRQGVVEITNSGVYVEQINIDLPANKRLEVRAANRRRPVIRLLDWQTDRPDALTGRGEAGSWFTLDGFLIAGRALQIEGLAAAIIRHSTLVPGWGLQSDCEPRRPAEPSLELINTTACVTIEHSIIGSIQVTLDEVAEDPIPIHISDSVLDATGPEREALGAPDWPLAHAVLTIARSTVFGQILTHAIDLAENTIFNGLVRVARRQRGCMRFCYVPPRSRTPRQYACQPGQALAAALPEQQEATERRVRPLFNSIRYGTPTYCQLAETCPPEIRQGADDESEMGVFHDLFQPQREANLRARLAEYTPAGADAGIIFAS
jgi:hypothetical protein